MKYDNQLRYGVQVIRQYDGRSPLRHWLKDFFKMHPQMGSRDRKELSALVYCFFRLGHAAKTEDVAGRLLLASYLCGSSPNGLLAHFKPDWNESINAALDEKIARCRQEGIDINPAEIFPWKEELSPGMDHLRYSRSFLEQPALFVRIRPGREKIVLEKMDQEKWTYTRWGTGAISLPPGTPVEKTFRLNRDLVIQDLSSQQVGDFFWPAGQPQPFGLRVWDCCAASGGKTILLHDRIPGLNITVTDIRNSILDNLERRLAEAGISGYRAQVADLSRPGKWSTTLGGPFDLIILDAPCTGSGTWSRTPEQLFFFEEKQIGQYIDRQRAILTQIVPQGRPGSRFVYITCSVFRRENEEAVEFIRAHSSLRQEFSHLIAGMDKRADSMFVAVFTA